MSSGTGGGRRKRGAPYVVRSSLFLHLNVWHGMAGYDYGICIHSRMTCFFCARFLCVVALFFFFFFDRDPDGVAATAVAALKGGKVVGIVVTNGGSGYADVSRTTYRWVTMIKIDV